MRILIRADNPGGRGRVITVLQNQGLIVGGQPVPGLRVVEIGPITITPAVYGNGIDQPPTVAAVVDTAYHANLWIVEPLLTQLKNAFTGTPTNEEDADNILFQNIREMNNRQLATIVNGIKRPEGWTTGTNVQFILPKHVATHRSIWC